MVAPSDLDVRDLRKEAKKTHTPRLFIRHWHTHSSYVLERLCVCVYVCVECKKRRGFETRRLSPSTSINTHTERRIQGRRSFSPAVTMRQRANSSCFCLKLFVSATWPFGCRLIQPTNQTVKFNFNSFSVGGWNRRAVFGVRPIGWWVVFVVTAHFGQRRAARPLVSGWRMMVMVSTRSARSREAPYIRHVLAVWQLADSRRLGSLNQSPTDIQGRSNAGPAICCTSRSSRARLTTAAHVSHTHTHTHTHSLTYCREHSTEIPRHIKAFYDDSIPKSTGNLTWSCYVTVYCVKRRSDPGFMRCLNLLWAIIS